MFPVRYQRLKCVSKTGLFRTHLFQPCTHPTGTMACQMPPARGHPGHGPGTRGSRSGGKKRDYPKVAPGSWLSPVAVKVVDSVGVGRYVSVVLDVLQRVLNVEEQEGSDTE